MDSTVNKIANDNSSQLQRKIKIDVTQLKQDAQTILDALNYSDFDVGIWLQQQNHSRIQ